MAPARASRRAAGRSCLAAQPLFPQPRCTHGRPERSVEKCLNQPIRCLKVSYTPCVVSKSVPHTLESVSSTGGPAARLVGPEPERERGLVEDALELREDLRHEELLPHVVVRLHLPAGPSDVKKRISKKFVLKL